jgi:DNA repair protein RadD
MKFIPRYYQKDCFDAILHFTATKPGKNPLAILPTGSGKSLVIANIVEEILKTPETRVLVLTHQKYLIGQNHAEFLDNTTMHSSVAGIYSAGLNQRDRYARVIFAGIQSIYSKPYDIGAFDAILIDEAHRVPHKTMGIYHKFLTVAKQINPNIVIVGFTATGYRLKGGLLTKGRERLFDEICHETGVDELIDPQHPKNRDGKRYLCPPVSKCGVASVDVSNIRTVGKGDEKEFVQEELQKAFDVDKKVQAAVKEIIAYMDNRKKVIIFGAGIDHCHHIEAELKKYGQSCGVIHSGQKSEINDQIVRDFSSGNIKYIVNIGILTVGFNEKAVDGIVLLHSTMSTCLYVQEIGRGFRLHPDKEDFLVLDFGHNIERHGAIDKIEIIHDYAAGNGEQKLKTVPQKICPKCQSPCHVLCRDCPECGFEFPREVEINHDTTASNLEIISTKKEPQVCDIVDIVFFRHKGKGGKQDTMRVDYYVNMTERVSEWICVEHAGIAGAKAESWIKRRFPDQPIKTIEEAVKLQDRFLHPSQILVDQNGKFPKILGYNFDPPFERNPLAKSTLSEVAMYEEITKNKSIGSFGETPPPLKIKSDEDRLCELMF